MRILEDTKLDFNDVLILPKQNDISSRSEVKLERIIRFKYSKHKFNGVPILASNMDTIGEFSIYKELMKQKLFTCIVKHKTLEEWEKLYNSYELFKDYISVSTGVNDTDWAKTKEILNKIHLKYITIDIANGHSQQLIRFVEKVRNEFPEIVIIAGNVVSGNVTEALILAGVDIVKVGIGPSRVCETRSVAGVGMPQLSAVIECAEAAHGLGGHIIADGGCSTSGDVSKAFCAGADFVMLGSMLGGHLEGGAEIITKYYKSDEIDPVSLRNIIIEKQFCELYGMASRKAQEKHSGKLSDYRSSEGRSLMIPYKGEIKNTILHILGGIRSTCSYIGASNIKDMSKCCTFVKVNRTINNSFEKYEV